MGSVMSASEPTGDSGTPLVARVIRHYRISILAVGALLITGLWALTTLPRSEDPEFDVYDCRVLIAFPGANPDAVETLVTRPVEDAIAEMDDIKSIESTSIAGLSLIKIEIEHDNRPADVVEEIRAKIDEVKSDLPERTRDPIVLGFNTADIPIAIVSLSGVDDVRVLHRWAQRIRQQLIAVPGVSSVDIEGMPERQILVDVNNERLAQLRIPLTGVWRTLGLENAAVPGGTLDVGVRRYVLVNPNEYADVAQIADTVIGSFGDALVQLKDVARVYDGFSEPDYLVRTDQKASLLLSVVKRGRVNTVRLADRIRSEIRRLEPQLPDGLVVRIVSDRGAAVAELLGTLGWNALGGGVIVILMVSLFLGVRQGLVVSVSIPLSVLLAVTLMRVVGIDLHQVSIFGLVLALGMLVDSGLVVVENIGRHLELGDGLFRSVVAGVEEVRTPVLASTLTTVAAFMPMLLLTGNIGAFIVGLPMTVIFALTGSLLVAVTVIPLLCYTLWRTFPPRIEPVDRPSRILDVYTELAKRALRNRTVTLSLAVALFSLSLATLPILGFQLFPKAEKSFFLINIRLPQEANLATTDRVASQVEGILAAEDKVRDFTVNIGQGSPLVYYNVEREREKSSFAQVLVNLKEGKNADQFVPSLQPKLRRIAGASVESKVLEQGPLGGAQIQIRIKGDRLETLAAIAADIRTRISGVSGLVDLRDTLGERTPRLVLDLDHRKAALLGIDSFTFSRTIFMALNGETATHLRTEDDEIPVVVRLDRNSLDEVSSLEGLYLASRTGVVVPFSEVATAREEPGFAQITHFNGRRSVTVETDVAGRLADDALADIERILEDVQLPDGYSLEFGGERQERIESFAGLGQAMVLALLLIYALLAIQFNSFVQPLVILLTVPFGLTGALFGLLITGNPFGFMAFIGVVSLTGIIINDSIVLADFANYLQRVEGKRRFEALLEAGRMRFRPVILTSVTTIGGLTPLAIWGGTLWSPLACSVIFGLVGATLLILVVMPVIYATLVRPAEASRTYRLWGVIRHRLLGGEEPG
jgi:multidrug efflux pump subunit AcrB